MKKKLFLIMLLIFAALMLTGCIPGDGRHDVERPANFLWGIWHGWIAPLSLIISLFNREIGIYEVWNTGFWYDFGFYIAVISGFGGLSLSRKKKRRRDDD
jgi:hypothetical protein